MIEGIAIFVGILKPPPPTPRSDESKPSFAMEVTADSLIVAILIKKASYLCRRGIRRPANAQVVSIAPYLEQSSGQPGPIFREPST